MQGDQSSEAKVVPWSGIGGGFIGLALAGASSWLLTALAMVWLARRLGTHDFGALNLGLAVASSAAALTAPNLNVWGSRAIARGEAEISDVLVAVKLRQMLLSVLVSALVSIGGYILYPPATAFAIAICSVTIMTGALNLQWVAQGVGRLSFVALNQLISTIVFFSLVLLFVRSSADLWAGAVGLGGGQVVAAAVLFVLFVAKGWINPRNFRLAGLPSSSAPGKTFAITSVTAVVIQYAGMLAVSAVAAPALLGFYSAAVRLYLTLVMASALVTTVFYPLLAKAHARGEEREVLILWLGAAALVGGLPGAVLLGAPEYFTIYVLGHGYAGATDFIRFAAIGVFFNAFSTAFTMAALAAGNDKAFLKSSLTAAAATLVIGALTILVDVRVALIGLAVVDALYLAAVIPAFRRSLGRYHLDILAFAGGAFLASAGVFALLEAAPIHPVLGVMCGGAVYASLAALGGLILFRRYRKEDLF